MSIHRLANYSCAENKFNICTYNVMPGNTLGYTLAKTKVTCLYINKMLMRKFDIKIMVDLEKV